MSLPHEVDCLPQMPTAVRQRVQGYVDDVETEKSYLRDRGGRLYKLTCGELLRAREGEFAYVFDLEAELFLAVDSPVTVICGNRQAKGVVVSCEDFQIDLILDESIGERVAVAQLRAEPWKLLEALGERLRTHTSKLAQMLMRDGPQLSTSDPIEQVSVGQDAAKQHVREQPITVIWGPPGTGKTHTMAEVAIEHILGGRRVLVVSHSNISVDGVTAKIAELMRASGLTARLFRGEVMRFGYVRDQHLAADVDVVAHNYALDANPDLADKLRELSSRRAALQAQGKQRTNDMFDVKQKVARIRKQLKDDEERCVKKARLVATTVSKLYANRLFSDMTFDLVMFDEVSMAYVAQVVAAATYATERLVLVGDFRQLAPIAQGPGSAERLAKDVFSFLKITDERQRAYCHPWLVMLDEQRRMHPEISAFSSQAFYSGLLKDHPSVLGIRDQTVLRAPLAGHALSLVDLSRAWCPAARNEDNSRFNPLAALVSFGLALTAADGEVESVGIIAPYVAQVRLIRSLIKDLDATLMQTDAVSCATVHQFQGSERDLIVLDAVESYPAKRPGILCHDNTNGSVDRLVNVAATRARGKLVMVANASFWGPPQVGRGNAFHRLCAHARGTGGVQSAQGLADLLNTLTLGPNVTLPNRTRSKLLLITDIGRARRRIVMSFPDAHMDAVFATQLMDALRAARQNKVEVMCKCPDTKPLPPDLKGLTWQSDDAVFPLVIIDDNIAWYGMPPARIALPGREGSGTVLALDIPVRIEGRNTVAMLMSLTALDQRTVDGRQQALQERRGTTVSDANGTELYGLAGYVEKTIRCKACKAPMRLDKGRRTGKFFLRCTACAETALPKREDVNHYFCVSQVRCTKCGQPLRAMLGRYGLYVKCDGPARHPYKLSEV